MPLRSLPPCTGLTEKLLHSWAGSHSKEPLTLGETPPFRTPGSQLFPLFSPRLPRPLHTHPAPYMASRLSCSEQSVNLMATSALTPFRVGGVRPEDMAPHAPLGPLTLGTLGICLSSPRWACLGWASPGPRDPAHSTSRVCFPRDLVTPTPAAGSGPVSASPPKPALVQGQAQLPQTELAKLPKVFLPAPVISTVPLGEDGFQIISCQTAFSRKEFWG